MEKIEKPDWFEIIRSKFNNVSSLRDELDKWFQEKVEPINKLLEGAVEVYGWGEPDCCYGWSYKNITAKNTSMSHKAYLIGIEPIKKETAKDILKELIKLDGIMRADVGDIINKAKKLLGQE